MRGKLFTGRGLSIEGKSTIGGLPLDTNDGTIAAAYSLRYLKTDIIGSHVVHIKRNVDGFIQGFTPSQITDGTLLDFTGSDSGFVSHWIDQSGNNLDVTQPNPQYQPRIVDRGSLILENGLPTLLFESSRTTSLKSTTIVSSPQPITRIVVGKQDINNFGYLIDGSATNRGVIGTKSGSFEARLFAGLAADYTGITNPFENQSIAFAVFNTLSQLYINNNSLGEVDAGSHGFDKVILGAKDSVTSTEYLDGNIQEVLVYTSDQINNKASIQEDMNNYYSIY